jgi:hypothetical protein
MANIRKELAGHRNTNCARRSARRHQEVDVQLALELVRAERQHQPRLGGRKLYDLIAPELKAAGVKMGRDRFFDELGKVGLFADPHGGKGKRGKGRDASNARSAIPTWVGMRSARSLTWGFSPASYLSYA